MMPSQRVIVTRYGPLMASRDLSNALASMSIAHTVVAERDLPHALGPSGDHTTGMGTLVLIDGLAYWRPTEGISPDFMNNLRTLVACYNVSACVAISPSPEAAVCLLKLKDTVPKRKDFYVITEASYADAGRRVLCHLLAKCDEKKDVDAVVVSMEPCPKNVDNNNASVPEKPPANSLAARLAALSASLTKNVVECVEVHLKDVDTYIENCLIAAAKTSDERMVEFEFIATMYEANPDNWRKFYPVTRDKIHACLPDHVTAFAKKNYLQYEYKAPKDHEAGGFILRW